MPVHLRQAPSRATCAWQPGARHRPMSIRRLTAVLTVALAMAPSIGGTHDARTSLPEGLVRLSEIDPTIRQDMRYAGSDNVLGRPLEAYAAPVCILSREAATALAAAQVELARDKLTLVVFDCLRPVRAVDDLVTWTKAGGEQTSPWHPKVARGELIAKGYVGLKSTHSRGSTIDIAIAHETDTTTAKPACGAAAPGMLDFGTGFDCFDEASRTASPSIDPQAATNRKRLFDLMARHGFRNYPGEWWHFTLANEPFKEKRFDMEVR